MVGLPNSLEIDYRHFDAVRFPFLHARQNQLTDGQKNITPRFEFGFGLSYTTFNYTNLKITKLPNTAPPAFKPLAANWEKGEATPIAAGSSTAPW